MAEQSSSSTRWLTVALAAAVAVAVGVLAWLFLGLREPDTFDGAAEAASAYAEAWRDGEVASLDFAGGLPGAEVAPRIDVAVAELASVADPTRPVAVEVASVTEDPEDDTRGTATLDVRWELAGGIEWTYQVEAGLVRDDDLWTVEWRPGLVHPHLSEGKRLVASRQRPERGTVLDGAGQALFSPQPVVHVGIATPKEGDTTYTLDQALQTAATVATVVGVDADALRQRITSSPPDRLVEVITLRRPQYDQVRDQIYDLPGTRFPTAEMVLPPTPTFAEAVLGRVGPATAEDLESGGGRIAAGDQVGHGGVQGAFDEHLAGTPGLRITVEDQPEAGGTDATATAVGTAAGTVAFNVAPVPGRDVQVTLDRRVQEAAEGALAGLPRPAALVAVRPSTGDVLAVANGGTGGAGYNRAMEGQYPPGSTFKVVTTYALLAAGLGVDETVACPPTYDVGGRQFVNAESGALGAVPFRTDFAESCNTAFVSLHDRVDDADLAAAGAALGLADSYGLGIPSFGGEVPVTTADVVEHAAAMIGQGDVLASPLGMALVAASVASDGTVAPRLVTDPAPAATQDAVAGATGSADPALTAPLRELMRGVVTGGTSTLLAATPGAPVHAKSGTAEFGTAAPPLTHAWMIGFQDDLAFAVLVEDGGFGSRTAGPVVDAFLRALA